MIGYLSPL